MREQEERVEDAPVWALEMEKEVKSEGTGSLGKPEKVRV